MVAYMLNERDQYRQIRIKRRQLRNHSNPLNGSERKFWPNSLNICICNIFIVYTVCRFIVNYIKSDEGNKYLLCTS